MKAIFPGSFDPVTLGHMDVIRRGAQLADEIVVAVLVNPDKRSAFTMEERVGMLQAACEGIANVRVVSFTGLLVDLAKQKGAALIIRGVRGLAEFESETAMAQANAALLPGLETVLLPAAAGLSGVSSSLVRQIAAFGGDVSAFVPGSALGAIRVKYSMTL